MPIHVEDLPDDIQQQILQDIGFTPSQSNNAAFDWGGLRANDIGGFPEFGADDLLDLGLGALSAINFNASAITNIGNLIHWGVGEVLGSDIVRIATPFLGIGETGNGLGAEGIADETSDLANLTTRNEFEF